jgi:hypothetical protein
MPQEKRAKPQNQSYLIHSSSMRCEMIYFKIHKFFGGRDLTMGDETRAPQLVFDDGARIMNEQQSTEKPVDLVSASPRGSVSVREYYEIDRLVQEIQSIDRIHTSYYLAKYK